MTLPNDPTDETGPDAPAPGAAAPPDLDAIGRDLDAVETALASLDDGSYGVDVETGEPIPDEVLAADPLARRA